MPKMRVDESIVIQEKPSKIYSILSDYHHWQTWSPWLLAEPEAKVTIADSGDFTSGRAKSSVRDKCKSPESQQSMIFY
jgi:hypothetical protein